MAAGCSGDPTNAGKDGGETGDGSSSSTGGEEGASGGSAGGDGGAGASANGGSETNGGSSAVGAGGTGSGGSSEGAGGNEGTGGSGDEMKKTYVYVGSGDWGDAEPGKITTYELDRASLTLTYANEIDAGGLASFLAFDIDNMRLFAVDEKNGGILSFSIDPATGALSSQDAPVGSNHPVYLELTPDGDYLFAANYGEGSVDVYPINGGVAQPPVQTEITGQQAHCITMNSTGTVLVANKGSDTISRFSYASGLLTPQDPPTTALVSPRHIVFDSKDRPHIVSETAEWVTRLALASDGAYSVDFQKTRLPAGASPSTDSGADIALTPNDSFLYVSNRGNENSITAFDLRSGTAVFIEHEPSGGTVPRKMSMDPRGQFLVVGNRTSQNIHIFEIQDDGSLQQATSQDITPSPFFVQVVEF